MRDLLICGKVRDRCIITTLSSCVTRVIVSVVEGNIESKRARRRPRQRWMEYIDDWTCGKYSKKYIHVYLTSDDYWIDKERRSNNMMMAAPIDLIEVAKGMSEMVTSKSEVARRIPDKVAISTSEEWQYACQKSHTYRFNEWYANG